VYELNAQNLKGTYVLHDNINMAFEGRCESCAFASNSMWHK